MKVQLRNSEVAALNDEIKKYFRQEQNIPPKCRVELVDSEIYLVNNRPLWFRKNERLFPTLQNLLELNFLKKVTVDMGAVKFIAGGADVMRPGIVHLEEGVSKDEIVAIVDEKHQKPLAVGVALFDEKTIKDMDLGKAVASMHYVGDRIWNMR